MNTSSIDYMIVGLGNPGDTYDDTRHNIGWMCTDKIITKYGTKKYKNKLAFYSEAEISGKKILIVIPLTYINRSGFAVDLLKSEFSIQTNNIIVITDDIRLRVGRIKIKSSGGDGGHNGIKSIITALKSQEFMRIRIGVGEPKNQKEHVNYVLSKIPKEEKNILNESIEDSIKAIELLLESGIEKSMNKYNGK